MKTITVVEMQSRLCETLAHQDADLIQVTYQGIPVVAVLALDRYQLFQTALSGQTMVDQEISRETLTQGQLLFHSYRKRLAPRLQGEEHVIKIVELTRRKRLVGALLAWNDWLRVADGIQTEEEPQGHDDHVLTIVAARNHLLKLPEQFAREELQGIFTPVHVTRQGVPAMVIVPWGWFERVRRFLRMQMVPFTRMERDGSFQRSSNEAEHHEEREVERPAGRLRQLTTRWSQFHQTASEIAMTVAQMSEHASLLPLDHASTDLEEQCALVARQAQELRSLVIQLRQQAHQKEEGIE